MVIIWLQASVPVKPLRTTDKVAQVGVANAHLPDEEGDKLAAARFSTRLHNTH